MVSVADLGNETVPLLIACELSSPQGQTGSYVYLNANTSARSAEKNLNSSGETSSDQMFIQSGGN